MIAYIVVDETSIQSNSYLLHKLGFSEEAKIDTAEEYDKSKEKDGFVAGKHIDGRIKWWFQR
jgi:hypothetical protein